MDGHLANLHLALERTRWYGLKMNALKYVSGASAGKFLGFIIQEHGIEIDPTKVESINKVQLPRCKNDMQKFLGKVNYLRQFISNLTGKISAFAPILRLKHEAESTLGANQQCAFDDIKRYLSSLPVMKAPMAGIPFWLYIAAEDAMIGAVLTQVMEGKEHIITYLSQRLINTETSMFPGMKRCQTGTSGFSRKPNFPQFDWKSDACCAKSFTTVFHPFDPWTVHFSANVQCNSLFCWTKSSKTG
jgi:hypothetical protein